MAKFKSQKSDKNSVDDNAKTPLYLLTMTKGPTKFRTDRHKLWEELRIQGTHGNAL